MRDIVTLVAGFVHRRWLVLLIALVAGAVTSAALAYEAPETYTASASIEASGWILQRYPELDTPDSLVRALNSAEFVARLAQAAGPGIDVETGTVLAYMAGGTQGRITIAFTARDRGTVEAVAPLLAEEAVAHYRAANAVVIDRYGALLANDDAALADIEAGSKQAQKGFDAEVRAQIWSIKAAQISHAQNVSEVNDAYRVAGTFSVAETRPELPLRSALGGGLLGLVAGVLVAYVVERRARAGTVA